MPTSRSSESASRPAATTGAAEWLIIREINEAPRFSYTLVNAPAGMPVERVVELSVR